MHIKIEDFKTGWFGLELGIKNSEIDSLIDALNMLKQNDNHFHLRSDFAGTGGVGNVEFYIQNNDEQNNIELDVTSAIYPENKNT
jgi:hypothetical protein